MRYELKHITIKIIDVTADAIALYGKEKAEYIAGRPLPDTDLRYEVTADDGQGNITHVTMPATARLTASELVRYMNRE